MDTLYLAVNARSNHQDNRGRQIRHGVYSRCDGTSFTLVKLVTNDFIVLEKLRKEKYIKSYR
jgi:hypothetical protein